MNQFAFILKDTTQKAFNSFFWFLCFLHLIAASVIIINTNNQQQKNFAIAIFTGLLLLTALFYLLKNKFRQHSYQLAMFILMAFFWPLQSAWLPAIVVIAVIVFSYLVVKKKSTAVFDTGNIIVSKSLFKKQYSWADVENVVLKDHLLSIDLKNNHLIQIEITSESFSIDETTFNQFCNQQLNPKP
jgi:cell division protein FtsW (lipid II flippase)